MGLSSLAVVMGIIGQVYAIDLKVNQLYQEKLQFSRMSQHIGTMRSRGLGLKQNDTRSRMAFRLMDFRESTPKLYEGQVVNWGGKTVGMVYDAEKKTMVKDEGFDPGINQVTAAQGTVMFDGWQAPKSAFMPIDFQRTMKPDAYEKNEPGTVWVTKEECEALCQNYLNELSAREKEIDMQLEELKARRAALNTQREEFTKYVGEGIKAAFKNNYA